jgi:hypothetical protein
MRSLKIFAVAALVSLSPALRAQDTVEGVAKRISREVATLDLGESPMLTQMKVLEIVTAMAADVDHKKVREDYARRNSTTGLTDEQVENAIVAEIAYILMQDSPQMLAIALNGNKPFAEVPEELIPVGKRFTALLNVHAKSAPVSQAVVDQCMAKVMDEHRDLLTARYGESYAAPFAAEIRPYLLTRCEPYMRWSASETIARFRKLGSMFL